MTSLRMTCPICGHSFDPEDHEACPACPLNQGCQMVCCPNCGYTTINPRQSGLARLVSKLMGGKTIEYSA